MKRIAIAASIQGALLIATSALVLPATIRMAEILRAEDFAEVGLPTWFVLWDLLLSHRYITQLVFPLIGVALVSTGVYYAKHPVSEANWLNLACWAGVISLFGLAMATMPLSMMGTDWRFKTPAYELRRTVITSTYIIGIELLLLLGTISSLSKLSRRGDKGVRP